MNWISSSRTLKALACTLLLPFPAAMAQKATAKEGNADAQPRKVFAHYMGCYPVGAGALRLEALRQDEQRLHPGAPNYGERVGGRWRDYPLTPQDYAPTREEAMDLEIRRAMRAGLDGFAVDVLAGDQAALENLDAMFKVAEQNDYPFEITFCLDWPQKNGEAIQYLLEKHRNSPKLARRNGKPLFMAYHSQRWGRTVRPELTDGEMLKPEGIAVQGDYVRKLEAMAGEPIHAMYCIELYTGNFRKKLENDPAFWQMAAKEFAKAYGGWSAFFATEANYDTPAKAAREAGMDWGEPVWPQYQSVMWNFFHLKGGSALLRERWERAIQNDATVVQIATWNDYTESSNIAPGQQTGYAFCDLNGLLVQRWKTGNWPRFDKDRIYIFYPLYPKGSRVYPFHDFASNLEGEIEVVTYLTKPGKIVMPGRNETWDAPAGLFSKTLPPTPGPVVAELYRGKEKVTTLAAREPITTRPFRAQHSYLGCSTQDDLYWKQDFPKNPVPPVAFYADDDGDGLPNWFEMYYCGKLADFSAATWLKPNDKAPGSDKTYLEAYLAQTDPFHRDTVPAAGTVWDLLANPVPSPKNTKCGVSTNPERDSEGRDVWTYQGCLESAAWERLPNGSINRCSGTLGSTVYSRAVRNAFAPQVDLNTLGLVSYQWKRLDEEWKQWKVSVALTPSDVERVGVLWRCPAEGAYAFDCVVDLEGGSSSEAPAVRITEDDKEVWSAALTQQGPSAQFEQTLTLKKGQLIRLEAEKVAKGSPKKSVAISHFTVTRQGEP